MNLLKILLKEFTVNGKMLIGYIIIANPWLTNYPSITSSLEDFSANPTKENIVKVVAQIVLAIGASHRLVKILKSAFEELKKVG